MDMECPRPSGTQSAMTSKSSSEERQQQQQQLPTTTFEKRQKQNPCELGTTNGAWQTITATLFEDDRSSSSGRTNNSPVTMTPCSSAGSTSPCSDRDSSPHRSPEQRVSHADRGSGVVALSPNSTLNFLDPETRGDRAASSRASAVRLDGASGGANLMLHGNGESATLSTVGRSGGSSPMRGGNAELRRGTRRSLAPTGQYGESWHSSSSEDEFNLAVAIERRDSMPKRKGKKRMRHRTPCPSPTSTTAEAGGADDTANACPPGRQRSKHTAASFSSSQLLPRSAIASGVSPAGSSSTARQTTFRDGREATMRLTEGSIWRTSPRLVVDIPQQVATSDAPSPSPPLEVLDLSLGSPMATEVIDIDTEDSPAPLPPPPRRGELAHDSLPTIITVINSSTQGRMTGESERRRRYVDGVLGAEISGGRGNAGIATSSGDDAGNADVATTENLRRLPVGLSSLSAVGTSHSARGMGESATVSPPNAALGRRSSSSSRSSTDANIGRGTEGNPVDREDERGTVGVSSHRRRRQSQQQSAGLRGRSFSRFTEVEEGEDGVSPAVARWTRRQAMSSDDDQMLAARLHQSESLRQEQSDLEMAQRLQSQEATEQAEYARAVAEVMQVAMQAGSSGDGIGDSGVGVAWPGVLCPGLDLDNHPREGMDSDSFHDELESASLETTDDEADTDGGVFMVETINHRGGTSSGNAANGGGAAARAYSAAVATSSTRGERNARSRRARDGANGAPPRTRRASAAVVDVAAAASDDDDVIPLAAGGSTSGSVAEGARGASSRVVRVGGSPWPSSAANTASGSSFVGTSISSSSSQAAAGAPQRARPGLSCASARARAGRGGPGSAAGGRGAYRHIGAAAGVGTATRRSAGASASSRSGAVPQPPFSGRAGGGPVSLSAAEARRRRQESNGTSRRRMSIAERYPGDLHIAHLMSQIMPSMVLQRGFSIGGGGRGSGRRGGTRGRGGGRAERGVAGTAAHFALMTRNLTSADYQQLLALDDAGGSGAGVRPKGLSAGEISMLPTQTGNGSGEVEQCCICMDDMKPRQAITRLPACLHTFHSKCISKWLQTHASCPIDKTAVSVSGS